MGVSKLMLKREHFSYDGASVRRSRNSLSSSRRPKVLVRFTGLLGDHSVDRVNSLICMLCYLRLPTYPSMLPIRPDSVLNAKICLPDLWRHHRLDHPDV